MLCRACLKLHAAEANTNYPPQDYEGEMAAAALLDAVPLKAAAASPGASEAGNSEDEDARRSELELSAMHGTALLCIKDDETPHVACLVKQRLSRALPHFIDRTRCGAPSETKGQT